MTKETLTDSLKEENAINGHRNLFSKKQTLRIAHEQELKLTKIQRKFLRNLLPQFSIFET